MKSPAPSVASVHEAVATLGSAGTPLTAAEVARTLDCPPEVVHDPLDTLVEDGVLETKPVGTDGRVWWRSANARLADAPEPPDGPLLDEEDAPSVLDLGVYTLDADLRLTSLNGRAETLLGTTEAEVEGVFIWDAFDRDEEADAAFHRVLETGETTHFLTYYVPWARWFDNWVYDVPSGIAVYFTEVTRREEIAQVLSDVKHRLELALNAAQMGTWEWDLSARTMHGDPQFTELFGLPRTDGPHPVERFLETVDAESAAECEAAMETVFEPGAEIRTELRLADGEDGPVWITWRGQASRDDPSTVIGVCFDITEQKRRERRLAVQRKQLKRQNDRLREFTDSLSHDLRTPLSIIGGRLALYRDTGDPEHLDSIETTTARMGRLVEDLLRVARHGRLVEHTEPTDLGDILDEAREGTLPASATWTYDPVRPVMADADRLVQVFENLLRNSGQHGGDDVTIRVGPLPDGFYVEDDGPGIPADVRDRVFDHGYTGGDGGTGYGLSIVRSIVDAHGWAISVTDATGGGARFEVTGVEFAP